MAKALEGDDVARRLQTLDGWDLERSGDGGGGVIRKAYHFKNYYETMAFVNAVAWIAHRSDHHPDLEVGYNKCTVRFSTHSVGGLSDNDFIGAAKVDALMAK
jgi:4a-hydroxytetrahydrobiopterin dehydratase